MATIAEIRTKYPQYSDMSDTALADALHAKFYSDLPKADFYAKVGLSAEQPQYASAVPQLDEQGNLVRQDAIPTTRQPSPGVLDIIAGVPEAALTLGTGAIASAVTPFAAVGEEIIQGRFGEGGPETSRRAAEMARALTYQPTTQTGRAITGAIGETLEGAGLEAIPFSQGLTAATMAPKALRQGVNLYARETQLADEAIQSIPAVRQAQEARVAQSYARAPEIEAVNLAQKYGIAVDPVEANPTLRNRARETMIGQSEVADKAAAQNLPKWSDAVKQDLGVAPEKKLTSSTFAELKNDPELTKAYDVVRQAPSMKAPDIVLTQLDDLRDEVSNVLVGDIGGKTAKKLTKTIEDIKSKIEAGVDGKTALASIQDLRRASRNIHKAAKAGAPLEKGKVRLAQIYDAAADALEQTIDANLKGKALEDYRAARAQYAKIYSAEMATTNKVTGQVDPAKLAKMLQDGRPLSGALKDLGQIAATFPSIAKISPSSQAVLPRLTRAGVGGAVGGVIGGMVGGGVGAPIGIAVGAAVGDLARRVAMRNMLRPGYQSSRAVPRDYRPAAPPPNLLRPVEPGQANIVPFDPRMTITADQPNQGRQNFVFGRPGPEEDPRFGAMANQLLEDPSAIRARREAQIAAAEAAAGRQSAGAGVALELDPITGRLRPAAATVEPTSASTSVRLAPLADTTLEDLAAEANQPPRQVLVGGRVRNLDPRVPATGGTAFEIDPATGRLTPVAGGTEAAAGSSLASAAEKLSKGQRFALTPEEMITWNRTTVELAELAPELNKLSPKAVAEKMMDRKWVESTIKKAREKEAAFREIEQRTRDMEMLRQARESRERLMDAMESLEAALSMPRAKEGARAKGQGPKTRAARNQLREIDTLNKLLD